MISEKSMDTKSLLFLTDDEKSLLVGMIEERKTKTNQYEHIAVFEKKLILDSLDRLIDKIKKSLNTSTQKKEFIDQKTRNQIIENRPLIYGNEEQDQTIEQKQTKELECLPLIKKRTHFNLRDEIYKIICDCNDWSRIKDITEDLEDLDVEVAKNSIVYNLEVLVNDGLIINRKVGKFNEYKKAGKKIL